MRSFYQIFIFLPGLRFALAAATKEVRGNIGGKVAIDCPYPADYIHVPKYWCRHPCNTVFDFLVKSEKSDTVISKGRVSLYDNPNGRSFSVTMNNLTPEDAGVYYCGVERWGRDKYTEVRVIVSKASPASTVVPKTNPSTMLSTLLDRSMPVTRRHVTQLPTDPTVTIVANLQNVTAEKGNHSTAYLFMELNPLDLAGPIHNVQEGEDLGHVYDDVALCDPADHPRKDSADIYHLLSFAFSDIEMTENSLYSLEDLTRTVAN